MNPTTGLSAPISSSRRVLALPALLAAAIASFTRVLQPDDADALTPVLLGAGTLLATWTAALFLNAGGRALRVELAIKKQHWVQACAHAAILLYWGHYWSAVGDWLPLIGVQLVFVYAFDMLLTWSRRDTYRLGFGPFPVVFSTNLFMWFHTEYFALQLLMLAIGFTAKELLRWERDGQRVHIFNPSSFALMVASVALLVANRSDMTSGQEIALSQFFAPHMYLFLLAVAIPGQIFFGVASMTLSAVTTTVLFGAIWYAATGTYYFIDSYVPIAVFLGMHLLFTDPSTSPQTELGRVLFGVLYALGVIAWVAVLDAWGRPTYYDKLLHVPLMNLCVQRIDRFVRGPLARLDFSRWLPSVTGLRRNAAWCALWLALFGGMGAAGAFSDEHPGQYLGFWKGACEAGRHGACERFVGMADVLCTHGSGWACNEGGRYLADHGHDVAHAVEMFRNACNLGTESGCDNAQLAMLGAPASHHEPPSFGDYRLLVVGSKGRLLDTPEGAELRALACRRGFSDACVPSGLPIVLPSAPAPVR